jgi:hypothetical protein
MQGKNKTFYIGSNACFETIEQVLVYNNFIAAEFLPALEDKKETTSGDQITISAYGADTPSKGTKSTME